MTLQQQIRSNRWRTVLLFILFFVLIAIVLAAASLALDLPLLIVIATGLRQDGHREVLGAVDRGQTTPIGAHVTTRDARVPRPR